MPLETLFIVARRTEGYRVPRFVHRLRLSLVLYLLAVSVLTSQLIEGQPKSAPKSLL
jgi:hypothetical protein